MSTYAVLFLGDVVGRPGRRALAEHLPRLMREFGPLFVIVNAENAAGGVGVTSDIAEEIFELGADAITLGNHAFNKREIYPYLDSGAPIVRPMNLPSGAVGKGSVTLKKEGVRLAVGNICGRVFLDGYDDPFRAFDDWAAESDGAHLWLDFHAEATSEKIAMGFYADGRATTVVGTHTHVTTADEIVHPGGTAYITDVGMCGPWPSVLGMSRDVIIRRFVTGMPQRFEVADEPGVISAVVVDVQIDTGRAERIRRIRRP